MCLEGDILRLLECTLWIFAIRERKKPLFRKAESRTEI
jgi:hypothetical protein